MPASPHPFPTLDQVLTLPSFFSVVVPAEYTDGNGHMNVARYTQLHSDGGWAYFAQFGLSEDAARAGGPTTFDVENHVQYRREVHEGDEVAVHVRLVERTDKALHSVQYLVNRTRGEVANSHEAVGVSIDLTTRRTAPISTEIAAQLDEQLARDTALDWTPPLCLSMGLRR